MITKRGGKRKGAGRKKGAPSMVLSTLFPIRISQAELKRLKDKFGRGLAKMVRDYLGGL